LRDSLDWLSREDDYWPISEYEATVEMPRLAVRYEECRREMQAEQERIERRKIENERLGRTLHRLGGEWTPMEKAAIALHEMFSSLVAAGFTKDEATSIVSQVMVGVSAQKQLPFVEGLRLN
jgi:predicted nuclease with TOPRIM domain